MWRQIFFLLGITALIFLSLGLFGTLMGQDISIEGEDGKPSLLWQIYCHFIDPGDQLYINSSGKPFVVIISLLGSIFMSGLLISTISNIMERRIERYNNGTIRYRFKNHIVIIGFDPMVPHLIRQLCKDNNYNGCDIVLQTSRNVEETRLELRSELNGNEEERVSFIYARRDSREELELLRITQAKEVFLLGEKDEYDHDSINMDCLTLIADICKQDGKSGKLKCNVLFEFQTTFAMFQYADVSSTIKKHIDFFPFNYHEDWAQKLWIPDKRNKRNTAYPLLDREPITENSEKYVHLIIIGMSPMGIALAAEAAHIAHFPNFITRGKKTRITFIDQHAEQEMFLFKSHYRHMFDVARSFFMDTGIASVFTECPRNEGFDYLGDFIDIEWRFVQGKIESPVLQKHIKNWAQEKDALVTVAVCFDYPPASIACSFYLPDSIYENQIPVLVYQKTSSSIIDIAAASADSDKYKNLYPFGMLDDCYIAKNKYLEFAKRINYIYDYYYNHSECPEHFPSQKELECEWDKLQVAKKWSNIYNAQSIPTKLRSFGIDIMETNPERTFSEREIELLAEVEHNRWNVEELLIGYSAVTEDEQKEIKADISLKNIYKKKRKHNDIRPYQTLQPEKTGKHAREYDRCISVCLPVIVTEKEKRNHE